MEFRPHRYKVKDSYLPLQTNEDTKRWHTTPNEENLTVRNSQSKNGVEWFKTVTKTEGLIGKIFTGWAFIWYNALHICSWYFCHSPDCIAPLVCPLAIWRTVLCPQYDQAGTHSAEFMFGYFSSCLCSGHEYPLESNRQPWKSDYPQLWPCDCTSTITNQPTIHPPIQSSSLQLSVAVASLLSPVRLKSS